MRAVIYFCKNANENILYWEHSESTDQDCVCVCAHACVYVSTLTQLSYSLEEKLALKSIKGVVRV